MLPFIVKILAGFFKVHPATVQTKTFISGVLAVLACLTALGTMVYNSDQDVLDYVAAVAAALLSLGQIFHRDALTKLGNQITGILPKA